MKTTILARTGAWLLIAVSVCLIVGLVGTYGAGQDPDTHTIYIMFGLSVISLGFAIVIMVLCHIADNLRRHVGNPPEEEDTISSDPPPTS